MGITTAFTNKAKQDFLAGVHAPGNTYKFLLLKVGASGTYDKNSLNVGTPGSGAPTTSNVGTDECAATGNYASGGVTLSGYAAALTSDVASIDWNDAVWSSSTISAIGGVLYNSTAGGNIIAVFDFGGTISSTNGTFTVTIPASGVGVIRIS
jgi:hypothetical protein